MGTQERQEPKTILVAVDDSSYASTVVENAARLAYLTGWNVLILSVIAMPKLVMSEGEINSFTIKDQEQKFLSFQKNLIDKFFTDPRVLVESKVIFGEPAGKICEYAETIHADLIIVGSTGAGRLKRFLGSVSESVAKNAKCSVMIVRR